MRLTPGTRLGPYEILTPLGSGGMGEVYRATDTRLGRDVALKVLPAEVGHDPERLARFRREAKALAQLDHPNIVTIYSVEECEGVNFLTMQLVEGTPLDRLIPAGGLPLKQIVEIASALGAALEAAHEKGIMHRDLKPANVMVSNEGRVKVLDFGLAKDARAAMVGNATLTSSQTQMGVVLGTPAYMSPEQTSGRPLDHRTDIFSLGVVLHEMATGRRPFEGDSSAELISAILRDNPPSVTDVRPDLPSDLARIIRRCLEKDPRHRVQTARDVSNEFRDLSQQTSKELATATPLVPRAAAATDSGAARADEGFWVAVLPFRYGGGNTDLAALAEGLTDEIVTGMLRFSYLRVIARGSTSKYSSESGNVRDIGKELGARYVMEGNLRQAGAKLRLAVQLVDAVLGVHIWAETYERTFSPGNIFGLQDDLVPRIVSTVADYYGILPHCISDALRRKADDQLSPYEAVLRAFSYFERVAPEEHAPVRKILERAVRSAPDQCEIWAMLSTIYWHEHAFGFNPQSDPLGRALAAARRSVDVAPTNNLGHSALAATLFFQKNIPAFRPEAERAIELNPMDGSNLATMGILMAYSGDWEHGCALVGSALQLNPHHPGWYWFAHFLNAYRKGDYRGALSIALKFNMPGYFSTHALTAAAYGQLGLREPAQKSLQELLAIRPDFAVSARKEFEKLYEPELVEQLIDGLRKAGLEIEGTTGSSVAAKAVDAAALRSASRRHEVAVKTKTSRQLYVAVAAVIALVIMGGLAAYYLRNSSSGLAKVTQISHWNKPINGPVISPDGHTIAFTSPIAGFDQVFVMLASGGGPLQLTNDSIDKSVTSFSPDGTQIYYSLDFSRRESRSVPTLGGTSTIVAPGFNVAPSPDGNTLYYLRLGRDNAVFRKSRAGLAEEKLFDAPEGWSPIAILPFPDGKDVLIVTGNDTSSGSISVSLYRINATTHASQKIGDLSGSPTGLVWEDAGKTVLCSRTINGVTNIWEYGLSDGSLRQITSGAGPDLSPMPASASKGIYFVNGRRSGFLTAYHPRTKEAVDLVSEEATQPAISWDGRHVAYITLSGNAQQGDLWISDIDGKNRVKVASGTALVTSTFSSDSSTFLFSNREGGVLKAYVFKNDGTGLHQIPWSAANGGWGAPSPDPNVFYLGGQESDMAKVTTWRIYADGSPIEKLVDNCGGVWDTSPDGKFLIFSQGSGSLTGVNEFSLDDHKCTPLLPDLSSLVVRFSSDGKSILYLIASRGETTIYRQPWHDGKLIGPAQPAVKLSFAFRQGYGGNAYDFSKDLSTVIYARPGGQADLYLLGQK